MSEKMIENEKVELKAILNDKLEKEVVAFLNSKTGGDIYIGINDDGSILGVENADKTQLAITDRIKNNIQPTTLGLFDVFTEEIDQKTVIHIVVSSGTEKPYYIKSMGMSPAGCYMRIGSGVKPMDIAMIDKLYASRTRNSLRNIVSPRYASHSFAQLKIYYEERGFQVNDAFLHNLDLYTADGKLNYVAYLLADVNSVSIKVAKYSGTDKRDLIENEEYGFCSLVKATERVLDKLEIENKTFTKITGAAQRLERRMIDKIALREAFINAVVHNDYTREVPPVVEIYADRLVITSYGGLVEGLSLNEFFGGRSMPRNRELMRVFRDLELVEQLGSGMNRILHVYKADIFHLTENFVEIVFPFEDEYLQMTHQVDTVTVHATEHATEHVTEHVIKLITVLETELARPELMKLLQINHRPHFLFEYLQPAINQGLIEMTIPDKPKSILQKYRLTAKGKELKRKLGGEKND
jgi:ATP-dependent DNA helicase RecG